VAGRALAMNTEEADLARRRHEQRLKRQAFEKRNKAQTYHQRPSAYAGTTQTDATDISAAAPSADTLKKAAIAAAMARVKAQKAG
jgi:Na+-translocating ferredoxin:NAD+ oxidoreductase subunit B